MQSNAAKKPTIAVQRRSVGERVFHAVGYEVVALLITAPIGAWLFNKPLFSMGALAIMLSSIAMVWNIIYNALFDRLWPVSRVARGAKVRILHGLGFEGGFILFGLPAAAWMLEITLWQALMVEIGFFLFSCHIPWCITGYTTNCAPGLWRTESVNMGSRPLHHAPAKAIRFYGCWSSGGF